MIQYIIISSPFSEAVRQKSQLLSIFLSVKTEKKLKNKEETRENKFIDFVENDE